MVSHNPYTANMLDDIFVFSNTTATICTPTFQAETHGTSDMPNCVSHWKRRLQLAYLRIDPTHRDAVRRNIMAAFHALTVASCEQYLAVAAAVAVGCTAAVTIVEYWTRRRVQIFTAYRAPGTTGMGSIEGGVFGTHPKMASHLAHFKHSCKEIHVVWYVDDAAIATADEHTARWFNAQVKKRWEMPGTSTKHGPCTMFLGMNVRQDKHGIKLSSTAYINNMIKELQADGTYSAGRSYLWAARVSTLLAGGAPRSRWHRDPRGQREQRASAERAGRQAASAAGDMIEWSPQAGLSDAADLPELVPAIAVGDATGSMDSHEILHFRNFPFPGLRAYVLHGLRYGFDTGVDPPEERAFITCLEPAAHQRPSMASMPLPASLPVTAGAIVPNDVAPPSQPKSQLNGGEVTVEAVSISTRVLIGKGGFSSLYTIVLDGEKVVVKCSRNTHGAKLILKTN